MVILCTTRLNIKKFLHFAHTVHLYVLHGFENNRRLFFSFSVLYSIIWFFYTWKVVSTVGYELNLYKQFKLIFFFKGFNRDDLMEASDRHWQVYEKARYFLLNTLTTLLMHQVFIQLDKKVSTFYGNRISWQVYIFPLLELYWHC